MVYKARGIFGSSPVPLDAPPVSLSLWARPQPPGHVAGLPLSSPSSLVASALALAHHQEAKLKKKEAAAAKLSHLAFQDENQWIKGAMLLGQGLWAP